MDQCSFISTQWRIRHEYPHSSWRRLSTASSPPPSAPRQFGLSTSREEHRRLWCSSSTSFLELDRRIAIAATRNLEFQWAVPYWRENLGFPINNDQPTQTRRLSIKLHKSTSHLHSQGDAFLQEEYSELCKQPVCYSKTYSGENGMWELEKWNDLIWLLPFPSKILSLTNVFYEWGKSESSLAILALVAELNIIDMKRDINKHGRYCTAL